MYPVSWWTRGQFFVFDNVITSCTNIALATYNAHAAPATPHLTARSCIPCNCFITAWCAFSISARSIRNFSRQLFILFKSLRLTARSNVNENGKMRLLQECARHLHVVYLCLRPANSTGYPPQSPVADVFLALTAGSEARESFQHFDSLQRYSAPSLVWPGITAYPTGS